MSSVFLSVLVVGEVRLGIERLRSIDPVQTTALEDWLVTRNTRDVARTGTSYEQLFGLFRGCFDEDVMAALLASNETLPTIEA